MSAITRFSVYTRRELEEKCEKQDAELKHLKLTLKGILAALSQPHTFPADIEAARSFARDAIAKAEERNRHDYRTAHSAKNHPHSSRERILYQSPDR